jgi:hypothetical protein
LFALAMLLPLWDGLADELGIGPGTPLLWGFDCTKCSEILFLQQTWKSKGFIFHDCGRGLDSTHSCNVGCYGTWTMR